MSKQKVVLVPVKLLVFFYTGPLVWDFRRQEKGDRRGYKRHFVLRGASVTALFIYCFPSNLHLLCLTSREVLNRELFFSSHCQVK